jgi:hypothetical protein
MATTKQQALQVLEQHEMDVERLRMILSRSPNQLLTLVDSVDAEEWEFTLRRRCHLFLMAKNKYMKRYEVIDSTSK